MKLTSEKNLITMALLLWSCHPIAKQNQKTIIEKESPPTSEIEYKMINNTIRLHSELQTHIEATEDGLPPTYTYTELDVDIALPIIAQGLKEKEFKELDDSAFRKKVASIFGEVFQYPNKGVKIHDHFITILDKEANEDEFDYTIDNIFVSKEYKYITWVPFLGDFVIFTDSNHYKIDLHPRLIARNKYLFNNSQPDLAYLLHEDSLFLKTLVKSFGYTKEPKINDLAMNDYLDMDEQRMSTVGEIIFVKNATGALEIKEELLKWISDHTQVNDNRIAQALSEYVDALYHNNNEEMYTHNPFTYFSLTEKRKITAFAANTYDPLYDKFTQKNARIWPAAGILENLLVTDEGLADYLKQQHYFSLPALKKAIEASE
jgi:hypothetical protein